MAFTTFVSGTAADADEVTANFYHIAQGDRLPRGGTSLNPTDSVYNIGATATTWANLYADTVNCTSVEITGSITSDLMPYIKYEYAIDSTHTATNSIEFTGLTGDTDKEYFINIQAKLNAIGEMRIWFNGDSSSSYASSISYPDSYFRTPDVYINTLMQIYLQCKSGVLRIGFVKESRSGGSSSEGFNLSASLWNNTSDELTSIKLYFPSLSFITGTSIQIWALPS